MRRTMGLDWGAKRIGVAFTDPLGLTVAPFGVIAGKKDGSDLEEIAKLCLEQDCERVIVGVPWSDDGSANDSTRRALAFAESVRAKVGVPVETWDESYTTDAANRMLKERGVSWQESKAQVDRIAAAIMLQSWLDSKPPKSPDPEDE